MKQHKWAREIHAWADGAEIEYRNTLSPNHPWIITEPPQWIIDEYFEYRIKPQPKEPQYLYVYEHLTLDKIFYLEKQESCHGLCGKYIGKIKLEVED